MNNLKADNIAMQAEIEKTKGIYELQAMTRILTGEAVHDEEILRKLKSRYQTFYVLCIIYENSDDEQFICSRFPDIERLFCNRGIYVYVTSSYISEADFEGICAIAAISEQEHDIMLLKDTYLCAMYTLNYTSVEKFKTCKLQRWDRELVKKSYQLSLEEEHQITNLTVNGNSQQVEAFLNELYTQKLSKISRYGCIKIYEQLRNLLNNILMKKRIEHEEEEEPENPANVEKLYRKIIQDFIKVSEICGAALPDISQRACLYIEKNYADYELSLTNIAEHCGITTVYLSNVFKKSTGVNISTYITRVRMEKAKQLINDKRGMKISEVAVAVGIENVNTFTRQFKNYVGVSPQKYRLSFDEFC